MPSDFHAWTWAVQLQGHIFITTCTSTLCLRYHELKKRIISVWLTVSNAHMVAWSLISGTPQITREDLHFNKYLLYLYYENFFHEINAGALIF